MAGTIRLATLDDVETITGLHVRAWAAAYRGILPDDVLDVVDLEVRNRRRRAWMESSEFPGKRDWLLEDEGRVIGWAAPGPSRDADLEESTHELYAIYLEPECVGHGHGRLLMDHCLGDVRARGFTEMTMWVLSGNERAQRFYAAAGFAKDDRIEPQPFIESEILKLRMRRGL